MEATNKIRFSANIQGTKRERAEAEARDKAEAEIKEKAEKTRKAREAKAKNEADFAETERAWAEVKAKEKTEIARLADEAREKAKINARVRKNTNAVNMAAVEAFVKFRFSDNIQGSKRERAEAEARAKVEADIWENTDKKR